MEDKRRLTPSEYPKLKPFFNRQRYDLCVYSLSSLIVWNNEIYHSYYIPYDKDSLIICFDFGVSTTEYCNLILPVSPVKEFSPEELLDIAEQTGFDSYCFVPEDYVKQWSDQANKYFDVIEHPVLHDYIYLKTDLAELKGNRYSKKRNLISQFKKEYIDSGRTDVEKIGTGNAQACIDFLEKWCKENGCDEAPTDTLACEKQAIINAIENIDYLEFRAILIRIDGEVSGFSIASNLTENMGVLNFEKAFSGIKGLYQYVDKLCAENLFPDKTYINKESDLGIPGLVKAKKSYHPFRMLKSYKMKVK